MAEKGNIFQRLTQLFRSGPTVKRRVRTSVASNMKSSAVETFRRAHNDVYSNTLSAYGSFDRMSRYSDFSEMEATPEISSALDIYSEECVSPDVEGNVLHIYSDNHMIKQILTELFYDILNIDTDKFDHEIWSEYTGNPKIVIIEINSSINPESNEKGSDVSSFSYSLNLARKKGYSLVCHTGNMIYVRDDLLEKLSIPSELINTVSLFNRNWLRG